MCLQLFAIFRTWIDPLLKVNSISPKPDWLQLLSMREDMPYQPDSQVTSYKHPLMISLFVQSSRRWCSRIAKFALLLHKLYLARQKLLVFEATNSTSSWVLNSMKNRNKSTSVSSLLSRLYQWKDNIVLVSWVSMNCLSQRFPLLAFDLWSTDTKSQQTLCGFLPREFKNYYQLLLIQLLKYLSWQLLPGPCLDFCAQK